MHVKIETVVAIGARPKGAAPINVDLQIEAGTMVLEIVDEHGKRCLVTMNVTEATSVGTNLIGAAGSLQVLHQQSQDLKRRSPISPH